MAYFNEKTLEQLRPNPDIGQTFYLVDGNYSTTWSKADGTGPLDLYGERNPGYVFGSGGGSGGGIDLASDAVAFQAAIDACMDFRGDKIYVTAGAYSVATALVVDVPDLRLIGQPRPGPRQAAASITAAVASAFGVTAAADRLEVGYLRFVPLTAAAVFAVTSGANNLFFHDFHYDTRGVTGSTSTTLMSAGNTQDCTFQDFVSTTDAAQGAPFIFTGTTTCMVFQRFDLWHGNGTTLAIGLADFQGAGTGIRVETGRGNLTGLASSAVTNLIKFSESGGDISTLRLIDFRGAIGFCAAGALVSLGTAEAAETGVAACYLDVVGGGAGGLGTTYTQ